jgi:hypothetical protein
LPVIQNSDFQAQRSLELFTERRKKRQSKWHIKKV